MGAGLLQTLSLAGAAEGRADEQQVVDAFVADLVADPNGLEVVSASTVSAEVAALVSKALGPCLLGATNAEVKGVPARMASVFRKASWWSSPTRSV